MFRGLSKLKSADPVPTHSQRTNQNQAWYENESKPISQTTSIKSGVKHQEVPWYNSDIDPRKGRQKSSFHGNKRFSFRKRHFSTGRLLITSKKAANKVEASKSTGDLIDTSEKKKKSRPLSLLLKPPEQVEDWYKSVDTPNANTKRKLSNPEIFVLSASSPNLHQVAVNDSPLPGPSMSNIVPGEVALSAYPPSPYEMDIIKNPFTSYMDQMFNENSKSPLSRKTGRSKSFSRKPSLTLIPPSPLTLSPSARLSTKSGSTRTSIPHNFEGCDGSRTSGPQTLSFGRNSGRYLVPTSLPSPNKSPPSLGKPVPNRYERNGGRVRCHSTSSSPFSTKTDYPLSPNKLTPQLVPVQGSIHASSKSATPTQLSRSFSSQASYSADALDSWDCEYPPKAQSMVNGGYRRSSQQSVFNFPPPFRRGGSERLSSRSQGQRSFVGNTPTFSHARNMTAPSYHHPVTSTPTYPHSRHSTTSTPTHTRFRRPTTCSLSYIRSSTTPTHTHSRYVSSTQSAVNQSSLAASPRRGSILSFSAYSDLSASAGSIIDTQSEIWSTGRQCYGSGSNHTQAFAARRGQRAFRSLIFPKRRLMTCMFFIHLW